MPTFRYKAISTDGQTLTGLLTADNRPDAVLQLKTQGARPIFVNEESQARVAAVSKSDEAVSRRARVTKRDILVFTGQLAALLKAGITLAHALSILQEQTESAGLGKILRRVKEEISTGVNLSDALQKHPKQFNTLYCSMVRVGESSGVLDIVLKQLASFMEAEQNLRSNVTTALAYPLMICFVGIASIAILVTVVIPRLSSVFADFGDKLPWLTRALINVSDVAVRYWWFFTLLFAGLGYLFHRFYNTPNGKATVEWVEEKTPALGPMLIKVQVARFARMMGTLVKSGIPVMNALNLVVETTTSTNLTNALRQVVDKVKKGEGLAKPLRDTGFFPPMVTNLIAVGEESGTLDEMFFQVADTYDVEVQHAIKRFITLFEPLVIILMAIGVGGVLVAFLLPILNISNMVS